MTDYQHIEAREAILQSVIALGDLQASHVAIYLTLLFAYIIVAYIAGSQLTRLQAVLVTSLFIAASSWEVFSIATQSIATGFKVAQLAEIGGQVGKAPSQPSFWVLALLWAVGCVTALAFMWSIRHPKTE